MSRKSIKEYKAIAGLSDEFPEIFGWNGTSINLLDLGFYFFSPSCDPKMGYILPTNEVYIPEIDGELFPIEKGYAKRKS